MQHEAARIGLNSLHVEVANAHMAAMVDPKLRHERDHEDLMQKVYRWQQKLQSINAMIKSKSHFNAMIYERERFGVHRYAAGQRNVSLMQNADELRQIALLVAIELNGLLKTFVEGPAAKKAALELISEALERMQKQDDSGATAHWNHDSGAMHACMVIEQVMPPAVPKPVTSAGGFDVMAVLFGLISLLIALRREGKAR